MVNLREKPVWNSAHSVRRRACFALTVYYGKNSWEARASERIAIPRERMQQKDPDFGTYHYTTRAASKRIRAVAKGMFTDAFTSLPFSRDDALKILDVGCGLGFLTCVCAEFYQNARIIGIDSFKHASLKGSSLERAKRNAKILGFSDRIDFKNGDIFNFTPTGRFDIIVSNLVFHNLRKKRFEAYSRLSSWTQSDTFVIMGDFFFAPKTDLTSLSRKFKIVREVNPEGGLRSYNVLVMSKASRP